MALRAKVEEAVSILMTVNDTLRVYEDKDEGGEAMYGDALRHEGLKHAGEELLELAQTIGRKLA